MIQVFRAGEEVYSHSSVEETVRHVMTSVLTDLHGFVTQYKSLRGGYSNVLPMAKLETTEF